LLGTLGATGALAPKDCGIFAFGDPVDENPTIAKPMKSFTFLSSFHLGRAPGFTRHFVLIRTANIRVFHANGPNDEHNHDVAFSERHVQDTP